MTYWQNNAQHSSMKWLWKVTETYVNQILQNGICYEIQVNKVQFIHSVYDSAVCVYKYVHAVTKKQHTQSILNDALKTTGVFYDNRTKSVITFLQHICYKLNVLY